MLTMPTLETERLLIRPFVADDLAAVHQLLDVELAEAEMGNSGAATLAERGRWLDWTIRNYEQLARLYQPPYGDRAVVLRESGSLIGACGYVPSYGPFGQLPHWATRTPFPAGFGQPEFGLYWAIAPGQQRRGYATEAGRALIDYIFTAFDLGRIVATTTLENAASIGVMRKLGMTVEQNPLPTPPWFQTVGVLTNPRAVVS